MPRQATLIGLTGFDEFWASFLKKVAKKDAEKAWVKLNPSWDLQQEILTALAWQFQQPNWLKENCQYAPNASTYLNNERWTDEKPLQVNEIRAQKRQEGSEYIRQLMADRERDQT